MSIGFGGDANIIRCLWCFTLLMNLHDFVTESFCLTADHTATCHMFLCPHPVSTVLVCLWTRVVWKMFGTGDDGIWSHSWSSTRHVETWQLPWSTVDSLVLDARLVECLDSWQRMQWYARSFSVITAGNGMPWTFDQVKYLFLSVHD